MNKIFNFVVDIFKCIIIGLVLSVAISIIAGIIGFLIYRGDTTTIFELMKRSLYYAGMLGLLLSCGFFIQRDSTRPFTYNDEWKRYFKQMNIAFVILFINLSLCLIGMFLQILLEAGRL